MTLFFFSTVSCACFLHGDPLCYFLGVLIFVRCIYRPCSVIVPRIICCCTAVVLWLLYYYYRTYIVGSWGCWWMYFFSCLLCCTTAVPGTTYCGSRYYVLPGTAVVHTGWLGRSVRGFVHAFVCYFIYFFLPPYRPRAGIVERTTSNSYTAVVEQQKVMVTMRGQGVRATPVRTYLHPNRKRFPARKIVH